MREVYKAPFAFNVTRLQHTSSSLLSLSLSLSFSPPPLPSTPLSPCFLCLFP